MPLILTEQLKKVGELLMTELQNELIRQGHVNTMELLKSIDYKLTISGDYVEIFAGTDLEYGLFVNEGRKAGSRKVPIDVLIKWVEDKGIADNDKEVVSIAYAIRETIFKEGIPTTNSVKFSEDGNRLYFIETVAALQRENVLDIIEKAYIGQTKNEVSKIVKNINKELNNGN